MQNERPTAHFVRKFTDKEGRMEEIKILSFAKINLSIDVTGIAEDGMHAVDMIMHQISFHDDVNVRFLPDQAKPKGNVDIKVSTNRYYLPVDERNLAYKAAALMSSLYADKVPGGRVEIEIFKRIPVAAGLAGGSGNGAAVLHGLNQLWKLGLSLSELCSLGARLGSDVPFCVMGQAGYNFCLPKSIRKDKMAVSCARATGTGTELTPLKGVKQSLVIAKPPMGVSTAEVYREIDSCKIKERPDNDALAKGIMDRNFALIYDNCINVLENYTLRAYPEVKKLKELLSQNAEAEKVLMSGSGPTVFGIFKSISDAKNACEMLRKQRYEAYWTKTTK